MTQADKNLARRLGLSLKAIEGDFFDIIAIEDEKGGLIAEVTEDGLGWWLMGFEANATGADLEAETG